MSQPPGQQPLNPAEKRYLLGEIIKYYAPSNEYLWQMASNLIGLNYPALEDMPLPQGRSLNECRNAFNEIRSPSVPRQTPIMRPMPTQSTSPSTAPIATKRPFGLAFDQRGSFSAGRQLLPKQSPSTISPYGQQSPVDQPAKKKRGRPTKAEAQARAEAMSASSDPGSATRLQVAEPTIARPPPPPQPPVPLTIETPRMEEIRQAPAAARMSVSSMLTPTGQKSASQSSSSSGKRRRGRSTRSEPEDLPRLEGSSSRQAPEYESPYARMGVEVQDSPARTAVLRHRDDSDSRTTYPGAQSTDPQDAPTTTAPPTTGPT